ncbi:MAG: hypothetical protein IJX90_12410 [Blautia sp.]|nr:hypothetical protein [Blautia sp.]
MSKKERRNHVILFISFLLFIVVFSDIRDFSQSPLEYLQTNRSVRKIRESPYWNQLLPDTINTNRCQVYRYHYQSGLIIDDPTFSITLIQEYDKEEVLNEMKRLEQIPGIKEYHNEEEILLVTETAFEDIKQFKDEEIFDGTWYDIEYAIIDLSGEILYFESEIWEGEFIDSYTEAGINRLMQWKEAVKAV